MSPLALTLFIFITLTTATKKPALNCPPGTFGTSHICKPCPRGTFQPLANQTSCQSCPPGTFHPFPSAISSSCIHCLPGTFSANPASSSCQKCPPGTESRAKFSRCVKSCPLGEEISFSGGEVCTPCFFGLFRGKGDGKNCKVCPDNKTTPFQGADSIDDCEECPAGFEGANTCDPCFPGSFREFGTGMIRCESCPAGSFTSKRGQSKCQPCPKNTFKTGNPEDEALRKCRPCPSGTKSVSGASFCRRINGPCPKHFFVRNNSDCEFCSKGFFRNPETNECEKCPNNSVSPGGTVIRCKPCGKDMMTFEEDVSKCRCRDGFELRNNTCRPCRPGTIIQFPRKLNQRCDRCFPGSIAPKAGSSECTPCPDGLRTGGRGKTKCIPCPEGLFWDFETASECIDPITGCSPGLERTFFENESPGFFSCFPKVCPQGFFKAEQGCETCKPGQRASFPNTRGAFCQSCKTRFEVSPGGNVETCTQCKRGFVRSDVDGSTCVCGGRKAFGRGLLGRRCKPCRKGTFNPGNQGTAKCFKCPPGTFSKRGARECKNCPPDTFSSRPGSSRCKSCRSGTFSYGLGEPRCIPFNDH